MTVEIKLQESVGAATSVSGYKWRAKLIAADTWGSTAYYPAEVLERDGARVFTAGLQMFQNHATDDEEWSRPEGVVENLVGKLESDALYEADNADGPGLYADVSFYPSYVDRINEIGKDIGLSVRASGLTEDGEMAGRYGPVLVGLLSAKSVDVVTRAGAGGKLVNILESDTGPAGVEIKSEQKKETMTDVTKEDFEAFSEALNKSITDLVAGLKESFATVEEAKVVETDEEKEARELAEAKNEVVIDHVAVVEALRANDLPAASSAAIIKDLTEGKSLEEAVKVQTDLREAFTATQETGTVVNLKENGKVTGLARSVSVLNG